MCDGAIRTIADWKRACKHVPDKLCRFWFCVGVVFALLSFAENVLGQPILVPGTWYDQDKYHLASEPVGGTNSWERSWGRNFIKDSNANGSHDPGEPASEKFQGGATQPISRAASVPYRSGRKKPETALQSRCHRSFFGGGDKYAKILRPRAIQPLAKGTLAKGATA